ncbi:redoxin domain-containing protein [Epibacterium sp. Ofav1-8]|uniref:redoxin domain-containing protein n=1 Tax=Epibacterium sp. Ofav1-8 TaxID=2917735 RepID=UPI001EF70D42|nr:redoxin domain-containing protein [Epibacterium sp. Ofav1-8]MCG7625145.1 redoxin domain-containing protein [Epibacterium sp. Ofav1-8]
MTQNRLTAGNPFPKITVPVLGGTEMTLGMPRNGLDWQLVVVYRGKHCFVCANYLKEWSAARSNLTAIGIDIVAVSADSLARAETHIPDLNLNFPVGYDLGIEDMRKLGLYISSPRSPEETDRPFAEPGHFVVNAKGLLLVADVSNAPFARPPVNYFVEGLRFIKDPANNYPIRGTFQR